MPPEALKKPQTAAAQPAPAAGQAGLRSVPAGMAPLGAPPTPQGPAIRRLKKGELLFQEGENSRAMYFLRTGMIRIYKKKGDSFIEIDTVHKGSVLGELAFLDGNPRSASGEALVECELMEISGPTFQAVLGNMPEWLKILLKTIVGRLRTAGTRIRQLEQASTAYSSDKDGKRSAQYTYLPPTEVLKIASSMLLVASRNGKPLPEGGFEVKMPLLNRYANQIMGVPTAKVATLIDIFAECGVLKNESMDPAKDRIVILDLVFLEQIIQYMNEEYLLEPSKRHDISVRGLFIMGALLKHAADFKVDAKGLTQINVAEVKKRETVPGGKEAFRMEEFPELVKVGYATNLVIKNADEAMTSINATELALTYKLQRIVHAVHSTNEQKR